jgi:hypothetical protein
VPDAPAPTAPSNRGLKLFLSCALTLYAAFELREFQFATPHMLSRDGYYHARYANLLPERGLSREFAWMRHSFWSDRFADKEFLFHLWLAPWCTKEGALVPRAKFAAWILAGAAIATFGFAVRWTGARGWMLWVLVLLGAGNHFLFRLLECRAHVLSILFFISGTALLLKGKWRWLAAAGFLYSWSYAAPHLLVGAALAHAAAIAVRERRLEWRGVAFSAAGVFAGLLLHPYTPNSLHLWWVQNVVVLSQAWGRGGDLGVHLGQEFESILPRSLVTSSTAVFASLMLSVLFALLAAERSKLSTRTFSLLFVAAMSFTLYCLSARFIEYLAPAAVWALASAATDLFEGVSVMSLARERPRALATGLLAAAALLVAVHLRTWNRTLEEVRRTKGAVMAGAARWTRANVPRGENVAHFNWGDFVQLFAYDPDHRYIVGLDPSFTNDPERIRFLEDVRTGRAPLKAAEFAEAFDTNWLVVTKEVPRQVRICEDALLEVAYEDEGAVVYRLR